MSATSSSNSAAPRELPPWLAALRRAVNVGFPLLLVCVMVASALPSDELPDALAPARERLTVAMRKISLSQSWKMYAPDPATGHFYMELFAHDA
ncbi:MAG TPA: hypothetical protein VK034_07125, partial [Enhygromyxa sp.]|nr:hypothetical protein [Enhygromyxa sp.]